MKHWNKNLNTTVKTKGKVLIIILAVSLLFGGCSSSINSQVTDENRLSVVTTIFAAYDFARSVCGNEADVKMLLKPGAEAHTYDPTPQDILSIENCDVFIYVGGENDTWVDTVLEGMDTSDMVILRMLDLCSLLKEEEDEADEEEWDEHVWTDPSRAMLIASEIGRVTAKLERERGNEAGALQIETDCEAYLTQLQEVDLAFSEVIEQADRKLLVFADRFPLRYFTEAYGLDYVAAFPGCSTDSEPSARKVAELIDLVREEEIPVIFKIELTSDSMAQTIAEETGAKILTFYSCHTISKDDFEAGETYISLMYKNVEALKEALYQ